MPEEKPHMWKYWRDKHGLQEALKTYFPQTMKGDLRLSLALAQIENAEAAINAVFEELNDEDETY